MYQLFLYILHHVVIYYLSFNLIWAVDAVKILWVVCVSVCVVHSEPQRDGVWRHRQCIRGTSSSRDPEHLRPLDQTTITRGTNNTRLERERYLKLTAVIMCWTLCNRCVCVCVWQWSVLWSGSKRAATLRWWTRLSCSSTQRRTEFKLTRSITTQRRSSVSTHTLYCGICETFLLWFGSQKWRW